MRWSTSSITAAVSRGSPVARVTCRPCLARADDPARLAVDVFCTDVRKALGSYAALLGGLDLVVFTGGIGEHSAGGPRPDHGRPELPRNGRWTPRDLRPSRAGGGRNRPSLPGTAGPLVSRRAPGARPLDLPRNVRCLRFDRQRSRFAATLAVADALGGVDPIMA